MSRNKSIKQRINYTEITWNSITWACPQHMLLSPMCKEEKQKACSEKKKDNKLVELTWSCTFHEIQLRLDTHKNTQLSLEDSQGSPPASSSSSFKTLLSSESSWADFLPSSTGTTVKLVGIFSACETPVFLLICPPHALPLLHGLAWVVLRSSQLCCYLFDTGWPCDKPFSI